MIDHDIYIQLNARIRELRISRGLSQVQLAECLGVTKQSVSNWENDNIMPSIEMLVKIAAFFSVSSDYVLGLDSKSKIDVSSLTKKQIGHIRLLINDFSEMNSK